MSEPSILDEKQNEEQYKQAVIEQFAEQEANQDLAFIGENEVTKEWRKDQFQSKAEDFSQVEANLDHHSEVSSGQVTASLQNNFDLESTKEWYPPSDRPLAQAPLIEPNDDLSDLKEIRLDQLNLESTLSLHDDVLTIISPRTGWRKSDILFILISVVVIVLLLLGPLDVVLLLGLKFGFKLFLSLTLLFWIMMLGVYVGVERQQRLVIRPEQIIYTSYLPGFLGYFPEIKLFKKTYALEHLIDVKNESYTSHGFMSESLVFKMKMGSKNILFGTHLKLEERQVIAEHVQAHLIRLQKDKLNG